MKTCTTLALAAILAGGAGLAAPPIPTSPIHTNKVKFRIPFHYDAAELARLGAREIRLYVSRDRGASWKQVQGVAPDAGKFNFQSTGDGEYWFIVRTLDSNNRLHPDGNVTDPGLQVIVDTARPTLELDLTQPSPGKVELVWNASDEHLDTTQLRLEYLQPGALEWQPVSVIPKPSGRTGWTVPQGGIVAVRGSISDLAKNTREAQAQRRIAPANQTVPKPGSPDRREPVAGPTSSPRDNLALTLPDRFPKVRSGLAGDDGAADPSAALSQNSSGEGEEAPPRFAAGPSPITISPRSTLVSLKGGNSPPARDGQMTSPTEAPPPRVTGRQRVLASKKFQIGYKLQDVGPSGVDVVELFITQDNGQSWYLYGSDDDTQSPIQVEVPREGTYGFSLGVRSGAGLASEPPHEGDLPAIVVVVDQTAPAIESFAAEQGRGKNRNKLLVTWKCTDENLAERPISLSYATSSEGPWQAASGAIEDSGSFIWTMTSSAPTRFHLRIEARDLAGNVQTRLLPNPVLIDTSRPTAQIIDVESPDAPASPRE